MKAAADGEILPLLRWLEGRRDFVFLDTARPDRENRRSFLFTEPREWLVCPGRDSLEEFFAAAAARLGGGSYLAGWFAYEFGYLLEPALHSLCTGIPGPFAVLGVFGEPLVIDHGREGQGIQAGLTGGQPPGKPEAAGVGKAVPNTGREDYLRAVRRIRDYIGAGDTYQVNYTLKLRFTPRGPVSSLYANLRRNQPVAYGAWIREGGRDILSFSPELFFRAAGGRITVRPMKGTMRRGATLEEDMRRRGALAADLKNRSENVMIVDLLRNDLARVCRPDSVHVSQLCALERYRYVLHLVSAVCGTLRDDCTPIDLIRASFPGGSVTGAPKVRAMEIIAELEPTARGPYCGSLGYLGFDGSLDLNILIRTITAGRGWWQAPVGGGIVAQSDPRSEYEETWHKAEGLIRSLR